MKAVTVTQRGWTLLGASIGLVIGSRALGSLLSTIGLPQPSRCSGNHFVLRPRARELALSLVALGQRQLCA